MWNRNNVAEWFYALALGKKSLLTSFRNLWPVVYVMGWTTIFGFIHGIYRYTCQINHLLLACSQLTYHFFIKKKGDAIICPLSSHFIDYAFYTSFDYFVMYNISIQTDWQGEYLGRIFVFNAKCIAPNSTALQFAIALVIQSYHVKFDRVNDPIERLDGQSDRYVFIHSPSITWNENVQPKSVPMLTHTHTKKKRGKIYIFRHLRWLHGYMKRLCIVLLQFVTGSYVHTEHNTKCDIRLIDSS